MPNARSTNPTPPPSAAPAPAVPEPSAANPSGDATDPYAVIGAATRRAQAAMALAQQLVASNVEQCDAAVQDAMHTVQQQIDAAMKAAELGVADAMRDAHAATTTDADQSAGAAEAAVQRGVRSVQDTEAGVAGGTGRRPDPTA
ncbi:hypothetical protein [Burkholderia sp. 22PA0106]|uniref:hypothetical protein n=1 Tax=Burkholderia sp. 22PA0106 TaxID=3237371 RepID=UPI0039C2C195